MTGSLSELGPEELEQLRAGLRIMALRALGDPDAAEDVAQETLARAVEALQRGRFREGESLGAFVRGIARHVIADTFRRRGRTRDHQVKHSVADTAEPQDALAGLVSAQEKQRLRRALERLSPGDRDILRLSYFEGLTPAQIAERLEEPSARIRKRKSRALERLRRAFLGDETGHESA